MITFEWRTKTGVTIRVTGETVEEILKKLQQVKDAPHIVELAEDIAQRSVKREAKMPREVSSLLVDQLCDYSIGEVVRKSVAEFLQDKSLLVCYYLWKCENIEQITSKDLSDGLTNAGEPKPINPPDILAKLRGKAYLTPAGKKEGLKAYRVTRMGVEYVEQNLLSGGG
jgi:hypothetical protein